MDRNARSGRINTGQTAAGTSVLLDRRNLHIGVHSDTPPSEHPATNFQKFAENCSIKRSFSESIAAMTTASSDHLSLVSLSTTMTQQGSKKRPGPTFVPHGAKKRRGLVSRTHSPRSEVSEDDILLPPMGLAPLLIISQRLTLYPNSLLLFPLHIFLIRQPRKPHLGRSE